MWHRFNISYQNCWDSILDWLKSRSQIDESIEAKVKSIIDSVNKYGDDSLVSYTQQFDSPQFNLRQIKVSQEEIKAALSQVSQSDQEIIEEAASNIRSFHEKQKENSWISSGKEGLITGQMINPVDSAGLYIPGGQSGETPLISSILMTVIPAQVAGVKNIIITSPPREDGSLNPYTLATANLLGVNQIFALGSAWSIAALALGTETIPKVDIIAGPGNIFVTTAKKLLIGQVGIDMIAGPSEIAVLADNSANPEWLAADLLSQAEHDTLASSILISPEPSLIKEVEISLESQLKELPRQAIAAESLKKWGACIQVPDISTGIELTNYIAPEHFELCLNDPWPWLGQITSAGAIFLGQYCPEPIGDYFAGPNHVLPTAGTARFSSALSVQTFYKKSSLLTASKAYIEKHGSKVARLSRLEGLEAHARSTEQRIK
ncbi:MAG TPA: histidinol dehydrogenase [Desulfohalobiaceae bacterium]|nr:histidinol dehydrogenase [Desulfohalobiaceae bacterium]